MQQFVTITSQGQITIPAVFRKLLGLDKYRKASVSAVDNKIVVEPVPDLLTLGGLLKNKAIKRKSIKEIMKMEKRAVKNSVCSQYNEKVYC